MLIHPQFLIMCNGSFKKWFFVLFEDESEGTRGEKNIIDLAGPVLNFQLSTIKF